MAADAADGTLAPHSEFAGCRILERLGTGGMADVYLGEQLDLRRKVAVKVIKRQLTSVPTTVERFMREARAAAAIDHPNVVTIFEVGQEDGVPFLLMQYVAGRSVETRMTPKGMNWRDAARIVRDVAIGLAEAHARGIIHRDIKPHNILLAADGRALLSDFGIARLKESNWTLTNQAALIGTPAYMAPEQAKGLPATPATDIYALGATLFHMLTGAAPFDAESLPSIVYQVVHEPPPLDKLPGHLPASLRELLHRMLEKAPAARPALATEVAHVIDAILRQEPTPPKPRRRMLLPALAMTVVVLTAATVLWILLKDKPNHSSPTPKPTSLPVSPPVTTSKWVLLKEFNLGKPEDLQKVASKEWMLDGDASHPEFNAASPLNIDLPGRVFALDIEMNIPKRAGFELRIGSFHQHWIVLWDPTIQTINVSAMPSTRPQKSRKPKPPGDSWHWLRLETKDEELRVYLDKEELLVHPGPSPLPSAGTITARLGGDRGLWIRTIRIHKQP